MLLAHAPGVALAALGTLPFCAVLGPEAPLIALGTVAVLIMLPLCTPVAQERDTLGDGRRVRGHLGAVRRPARRRHLLVEAAVALGAALIPVDAPGPRRGRDRLSRLRRHRRLGLHRQVAALDGTRAARR